MLEVLQKKYYLVMAESDQTMIVESRGLTTDPEEGNHIVFSGRSLGSILDRRIVWNQTILSGNFQDGIEQLLNENAINPTIPQRVIPNLRFVRSIDPTITSLTIDAQFMGDNLLTVIEKLCTEKKIGWKIILTDDNHFDFMLYSGVDRSYSQTTNPYVIFSPKFDNLLGSNYAESNKEEKTVTLVGGEGEGVDRKTIAVEARDISSNVDGGTLSETDYNAQLTQRGKEDLAKHVAVTSFEGQVDSKILYKYGKDFFMGDIVQIANEYDMETKARIVEFIHSQDINGESHYPTFAKVE
jgi:hypothetical protein